MTKIFKKGDRVILIDGSYLYTSGSPLDLTINTIVKNHICGTVKNFRNDFFGIEGFVRVLFDNGFEIEMYARRIEKISQEEKQLLFGFMYE